MTCSGEHGCHYSLIQLLKKPKIVTVEEKNRENRGIYHPVFLKISFQAASKKINLCIFHSSEYAIAPFLCYSCWQHPSHCGSNQPLKTLSLLENKGVIIHTDEFQSWVQLFHALNIWLCCLYTYCLGLFFFLLYRRVCYCCPGIFTFVILRFGTCFVLISRSLKKFRNGLCPLVHSQNVDSLRANSITVGYFCWNICVQLLSVLASCSSTQYWKSDTGPRAKAPFFVEITKAAIAVDDALDYVTLNMMNGCNTDQSAGMWITWTDGYRKWESLLSCMRGCFFC